VILRQQLPADRQPESTRCPGDDAEVLFHAPTVARPALRACCGTWTCATTNAASAGLTATCLRAASAKVRLYIDHVVHVLGIAGLAPCPRAVRVLARSPRVGSRRRAGSAWVEPRWATSPPLIEILVRNWGALIALIGGVLHCGAYHRSVRLLVLTVAGLSKLSRAGLVFASAVRGLASHGYPVKERKCIIAR
jgi:hypothetical protein